jgi:hypothetical protein
LVVVFLFSINKLGDFVAMKMQPMTSELVDEGEMLEALNEDMIRAQRAIEAYRKKWDDTKGGWSDTPAHGPESHGADAIRYMATTYMESYNYTPDHGTVGISKDGVHIESVWK